MDGPIVAFGNSGHDGVNVKQPAVYFMANGKNGTLYSGVTSNLIQRVWQHKEGYGDGFTSRHGCTLLVCYELHETMESAIQREKRLKKYKREQKIRLIEKDNPNWVDLYPSIL